MDRRKKALLIRLAVAGGLILIILAVLLISGKKKEKVPAVQEEQGELTEETENPEKLPEEGSDVENTEESEAEPVIVNTVKVVPSEIEMITKGIDVSEYQGLIDWEQVAASGIEFAVIRVGYRSTKTGEIKEDLCARYNLQEAAARGIQLGAYFFSTAVNEQEAQEEAEWICELLAGYPITYPVAYNCEGFQQEDSRQYTLSMEERSNLARVFLDTVEAHGYTGMFYAAKNELVGDLLWETSVLEQQYRIWVAQYTTTPYAVPDYAGIYTMWQYTNRATVPGIDSPVDENMAYVGYTETAKPKSGEAAAHVEANPEVGVQFEEVQEQVTAKDVTNLRSSMDQSQNGNIVTQLKNGATALRTGKGNNGWSRVEYNGQVLYAVSSYLTTDLSYQAPVKEPDDGFKTQFTRVSEQVTAKEVTNLRNRPSVEAPSEVLAQLYHGEVIVRTGVSDVGWSRVEYNGQTLYCISSYLQTVE